jgi:hypothetical protein
MAAGLLARSGEDLVEGGLVALEASELGGLASRQVPDVDLPAVQRPAIALNVEVHHHRAVAVIGQDVVNLPAEGASRQLHELARKPLTSCRPL